jgi:hypothetical protein
LEKDINTKCGGDLEANIHTLRKPKLIILNIPEDISTTNLEVTLLSQNPDLNFKKGDITAKFSYETKKQIRNLVMEVGAHTRKLLIQREIKLGWQICKIEDCVVTNVSNALDLTTGFATGSNLSSVRRNTHVKGAYGGPNGIQSVPTA